MKTKYLVLACLLVIALTPVVSAAPMLNFSFKTATASDDQGPAYIAWNAADQLLSTAWQGNDDGSWWQGDFGSGVLNYVDGYNITLTTGLTAYGPQSWFLYGSEDGTTMRLLDKRDGPYTWVADTNKTFQITQTTNKTLYRYMRLFVRSSDAGSNPAVSMIQVYNEGGTLPTTDFVANTTQFVTPQTVLFTNTTLPYRGVALNWSFGDGTDWTGGRNPTHVYGGNSTYYSVTLKTQVPGYNDTYSKQTNYIRALPKIATFTTSIPISTVHRFDTVTFTSTSNFTAQAGSTNVWTIYNSTGAYSWTGNSVNIGFSYPDTYDIALNTTNAWGSNTTALASYITVPDIAVSDIKPVTNIQYTNKWHGTAIQFNDTGSDLGVDYWTWDFGDGNYRNVSLATFKNTTYTYNATGTYTPKLTKANPYGVTTNSTPTDSINLYIGSIAVDPVINYANRNMTGMFTLTATNISRADDVSMYIAYNFTQINITSINLNSSASSNCPTAVLDAHYETPGSISLNITSKDFTGTPSIPCSAVDVHYVVKDMTNYSATYGYPLLPINLGTSTGSMYIIGNKTLYSGTKGAMVPAKTNGAALFTNASFTKTVKFYNNVNNQKISGQTVTVQWIPTLGTGTAGSGTTTTGEYTITSAYDIQSITAQATGYYNGTSSYVWNNSATESQFITPLSGASGSTVWYTPKQVRFRVMDGNNNPLPSSTVTAAYVATTLPSSDPTWLQTAYGISRSVANDMVTSSVAMSGTTGKDGYLTFTMHGSLQYNISVYNTTSGVNGWNILVYPMDNEYLLRVLSNAQSTAVTTSSVTPLNGTVLWAQALTANIVRVGLNFTDTSGQSTNVQFRVWDAINGTVYNTNTSAAPGVAMYRPYYDLPNVRGNKYLWNYSAVRP